MRSNPAPLAGATVADLADELRARIVDIVDSAGTGSGITVTCSLDEIEASSERRVLTIKAATGNNLSVRIRRASSQL